MAKRQITRKDDDDDDDEEDKYKDNEEEEEADNNNKKQKMLSRVAPSPRLQLSPKILMIINELFIDQFGDNLQQASSSKVNWLYLV